MEMAAEQSDEADETPRAACGVACSPFGEHRGFRRLSVCSADKGGA